MTVRPSAPLHRRILLKYGRNVLRSVSFVKHSVYLSTDTAGLEPKLQMSKTREMPIAFYYKMWYDRYI